MVVSMYTNCEVTDQLSEISPAAAPRALQHAECVQKAFHQAAARARPATMSVAMARERNASLLGCVPSPARERRRVWATQAVGRTVSPSMTAARRTVRCSLTHGWNGTPAPLVVADSPCLRRDRCCCQRPDDRPIVLAHVREHAPGWLRCFSWPIHGCLHSAHAALKRPFLTIYCHPMAESRPGPGRCISALASEPHAEEDYGATLLLTTSMLAILPSTRRIARSAWEATTGSWVAIIKVLPVS